MENKESETTVISETDYKTLWQDSENKLAQKTERFQKRVIQLVNEQETLQEKLNNIANNHEAKVKAIEKEPAPSMHSSLTTIASNNDSDRDVLSFREPNVVQSRQISFSKEPRSKEIRDPFVLTQRKRRGSLFGAKATDKDTKRCEYPSCNSKSVDLILCSQCQKYVCEDCNDVSILKLKILMDKCPTIYFICRKCNQAKLDGSEGLSPKFASSSTIDENEIINSLRKSLEKEIRNLEYKFERLIDQLVDKRIDQISYRRRESNSRHENIAYRKMSKDDNFIVETRNRHCDDYPRRSHEQIWRQELQNEPRQERRIEKEECQCTDYKPAQKAEPHHTRRQKQIPNTPSTPETVYKGRIPAKEPVEQPAQRFMNGCCNAVGTQYGNEIINPMQGSSVKGMGVGLTPLTAASNNGAFYGGQPMYDNEVIRRFLENIAIENQLKGMSFNQNVKPNGEKLITLKELIRKSST